MQGFSLQDRHGHVAFGFRVWVRVEDRKELREERTGRGKGETEGEVRREREREVQSQREMEIQKLERE